MGMGHTSRGTTATRGWALEARWRVARPGARGEVVRGVGVELPLRRAAVVKRVLLRVEAAVATAGREVAEGLGPDTMAMGTGTVTRAAAVRRDASEGARADVGEL